MTAKTKSERFRRLLSQGYFAPELPPCFVSEDLARYRKYICDGIEALPTVKGKPAFHRFISEPSWFYFPRYGRDDRRHAVPNPISYLLLAKVVADNYVDLRILKAIDTSKSYSYGEDMVIIEGINACRRRGLLGASEIRMAEESAG